MVDEYGEVEGMVTLEDILEEIVGDISDEHDIVVAGVRPQPDGSVVVDGSVPIRDLNRAMDWHLPDEEATTVAGLVIHEARSIPERGQSFTFHGFRFRVLRRERNRITALRIVAGAARNRTRGTEAARRHGVLGGYCCRGGRAGNDQSHPGRESAARANPESRNTTGQQRGAGFRVRLCQGLDAPGMATSRCAGAHGRATTAAPPRYCLSFRPAPAP